MSYFSRILGFIRRNRWKLVIAAVVVLPIAGIIYAANRPKKPEYVTAVSARADLRQTVEAVGTVVSERDLQLQFPQSGVVSAVTVKEGDRVRAGQTLALLRTGNASADVASAAAQVQSANADLRALLEGSRPEDIAISQADVDNKRASLQAARTSQENAQRVLDQSNVKLETLKRQQDIAVSGQLSTVGSTVRVELTDAQNALATVENIFGNNDVQDALIKSSPSTFESIAQAKRDSDTAVSAQLAVTAAPADAESAIVLIERGKTVIGRSLTVLSQAYGAILSLPTNGSFQHADQQNYADMLATQRAALQSSLSTLDATSKSLRDAIAGIDTQIAAEESSITSAQGALDRAKADITTYQTALQISEAQLALKKAGARKTDIDAATARLRQAQASLARAQATYSNNVLTAPIAGTVTKVNVKIGEITPVGPAVTLLGESPFRVEMYVSEIDVPKVQLTQTGSIELDAFRGTHFALRVSQVDTAPTDRDGVSKYRVKLDFVYPHDELKIGMTGDADILTDKRAAVIAVPQRAVIENEEGETVVRVLKDDGTVEERTVVTGMEGEGGNVEVTGIEEGETIIVLVKE